MNKQLTIVEIKKRLSHSQVSQEDLTEFAHDKRKGVQIALRRYVHQQMREKERKEAFEQRMSIEHSFWEKKLNYVAGVDEVGRGPLAGPVVAAAVILPHDFNLIEVNDSKQLTEVTREKLYDLIIEQAVSVAVGVVDSSIIDEINIYEATRVAMKEAVETLSHRPNQLIVDAMQIDVSLPQLRLIKADAKSASVAAASIVAKVYRDHLMRFYAQLYPGYGFEHNDGYGTKQHLQGLKNQGICEIHRRSFEPVKSLIIN